MSGPSSPDSTFEPVKLGEVRPSQLIHTYGSGSVLELPNFSVIVPGIDGSIHQGDPWHTRKRNTVIQEERLLGLVQGILGPTVTDLRGPVRVQPPPGARGIGEWDATGTWTLPFPRWMRCRACNTLSRYDSGKFQLDHPNTYRPHEARFVHGDCTVLTKPTVMPVRFVLACPDGHLDDFPWGAWAHRQNHFVCPVSDNPQSNLGLEDVGLAQRPTSQKVVCRHNGCDQSAAVQPAFGPDGWMNLPKCGGGRPHLGDREDCSNNVVALLVGATNLWFADRRSVLSIPHDEVPIVTQVVRDNRPTFEQFTSLDQFETFAEDMAKYNQAKWLRSDQFTIQELWEEFQQQESTLPGENAEPDVLGPEWVALTQPVQGEHPDFKVEGTKRPPDASIGVFAATRLVTRLREVSALVGFTRLDSPSDRNGARAPLTAGQVRWVPAAVSLGEGILVRLDEGAVQKWELAQVPTFDRIAAIGDAHQAWRRRRGLDPSPPPNPRFMLIHTIAHLLIQEISHEAGYAAASIRERIYARTPAEGSPMAGVLLYTAAPDAEGTLGGLVALGAPDRLGDLIDGAMERARICTSDPFCATHLPNGVPTGGSDGDGSLHGAACHVCLFLPETSCDHANRYLDRTLVVPTLVDGHDRAFTS